MACCSCEASGDPSVENPDNPPYDPLYPLLDPSLDLEEIYPSNSWRDGPPPLDPPPDPPLDPLPLTINISSLDLLSDPPNLRLTHHLTLQRSDPRTDSESRPQWSTEPSGHGPPHLYLPT